MAFTKRVLNRGLLAAGSVLLAVTSLCLCAASLWLLARYHPGVTALSLATVISAFVASAFACFPAAGLAVYMAFRSMRCREPPHQCLPNRLSKWFRAATSAAIGFSMIPCALGLSFALSSSCNSDESIWHQGLSCQLLKIVWALSLLMLVLAAVFLLPLRGAMVASALPPVKKESDTESTSSFEKPEVVWPTLAYANFERPSTREQERWMQRRNSLSSQKAIYPYAFETRRSATYSMGYAYSPGSHYSFQRNTMRSFSDSQPTLYDPHRSGSFSSNSRPVTAISSTGSFYSRRYRQPDPNCPAIPESPSQSLDTPEAQPKTADVPPSLPPPPPPAWCPPLQHAPLSSDPAIRALTGSPSRQLKTLGSSTISSTYSPTHSKSTTTMPSLSRATTAHTSILNVSRPSTAMTTSRSGSSVSSTISPTSSRDSSPPPMPALPSPPSQPPPAVPTRAPGHAFSGTPRTPTLSAYGPGIATARSLRRPEMIGVRGGAKQKKHLWSHAASRDKSVAEIRVSSTAASRRYTPSNYSVASNPWAVATPVLDRPSTPAGGSGGGGGTREGTGRWSRRPDGRLEHAKKGGNV